jgi:hypothetical protein
MADAARRMRRKIPFDLTDLDRTPKSTIWSRMEIVLRSWQERDTPAMSS